MNKLWLIAAIFILFVLSYWHILPSTNTDEDKEQRPPIPVMVKTIRVHPQNMCSSLAGYGKLRAARVTKLFFEQSGLVTALGKDSDNKILKVGSPVYGPNRTNPDGQPLAFQDLSQIQLKANQIQIRLDSLEISYALKKLALKETKLNLEETQHDFQRMEALSKHNAISKSEMDKAKHSLASAKIKFEKCTFELKELEFQEKNLRSELALLELAKQKSVLRAPFDGVITELEVQEHQFVTGATHYESHPAVTIISNQLDTIDLVVLNRDARTLRPGMSAFATSDDGHTIPAVVDSVIPQTTKNRQTRKVVLTIDSARPDWVDGQEFAIKVIRNCHDDALAVPESALIHSGDKEYIYRIRDFRVQKVLVKPGISDGNLVQILEGVEAGDIVVKEHSGIDLEGVFVDFTGS